MMRSDQCFVHGICSSSSSVVSQSSRMEELERWQKEKGKSEAENGVGEGVTENKQQVTLLHAANHHNRD